MTVLKQTPLKIDFGTEYTSFKMTDTPQSFFESIAGLETVSSAIYKSLEPGASVNSLCVASPEKNVVRRCTSSTKKRLTVKSIDFYSLVEPNWACGTFWMHDGVLLNGMRCD